MHSYLENVVVEKETPVYETLSASEFKKFAISLIAETEPEGSSTVSAEVTYISLAGRFIFHPDLLIEEDKVYTLRGRIIEEIMRKRKAHTK